MLKLNRMNHFLLNTHVLHFFNKIILKLKQYYIHIYIYTYLLCNAIYYNLDNGSFKCTIFNPHNNHTVHLMEIEFIKSEHYTSVAQNYVSREVQSRFISLARYYLTNEIRDYQIK